MCYNFHMKDWTNIYKKYKGSWIALEDDQETVIAAAKDVKSALKLSESRGNSDPILFRVPDKIVDFVGYEGTI